VSGTLTVEVAEDIKAAVAIRLLRRCTYVADADSGPAGGELLIERVMAKGGSCVVHEEQVAIVELFPRRSFTAGPPEHATFSIAVPGDAGPSTLSPHAQVDWRLEAVLDRRLRADLDVLVPIVVT